METKITVKEAARILGVSVQSVYNMRKRGVLKTYGTLRQSILFDESAVYALAASRIDNSGEQTIADLSAKVTQSLAMCYALERRIKTLEQLQGLDVRPLPVDREGVLQLLLEAEDLLLTKKVTTSSACIWLRRFNVMHEEFFNYVEEYAERSEPWTPFIKLAELLYTFSVSSPTTSKLTAELHVVRNQLKRSVWMYLCNRRGIKEAAKVVPVGTGDLIDELLHVHLK